MPKTITFTNINIKDFSISKNEGKFTISIVYSLIDGDGKEWDTKRIDIKDLTTAQKNKVEQILIFLENKIKIKEKI